MAEAAHGVAVVTFGVMFAACVVVLNVLTIVAIAKSRSVRVNHSNMFILHLAVLDILMMAPQLFFARILLTGEATPISFIITGVCFSFLAIAAMLNTFAISVDRFLFIQKAMTYQTIVTSARVKLVVFFIWVLALFVGTIPLYDIPFHKIASNSVYLDQNPEFADCDANLTRHLQSSAPGNTSSGTGRHVDLEQKTNTEILFRIMTSCPQLTNPALRAQTILLFLAFCAMGVVSIGLYTKMFLVIRQHNVNRASHASLQARDDCSCESQGCPLHKLVVEYRQRRNTISSSIKSSRKSSLFKLIRRGGKPPDQPDTAPTAAADPTTSSSTPSRSDSFRVSEAPSSPLASTSPPPLNGKDNAQIQRVESSFSHSRPGLSSNGGKAMTLSRATVASIPSSTVRRKKKLSLCQHFRDMRTIKMLMTMFVIFYVCWSPVLICKIILHGFGYPISNQVMMASWVIGTSNSVWNFFVYPMRIRELRATITRLVCFFRTRRGKS